MGITIDCDECKGSIYAYDYQVCGKCYAKMVKKNKELRAWAAKLAVELKSFKDTTLATTQKLPSASRRAST